MGQEGGQLDLAVHGGSEAGPAVHGCAPVHRDHRGAVAAQAHTALQNLVVPTQLQGDRRQQHQALLTNTCSLFTSWGQTALSPGGCHPKPRTGPGTHIPLARKSQVRHLDLQFPDYRYSFSQSGK